MLWTWPSPFLSLPARRASAPTPSATTNASASSPSPPGRRPATGSTTRAPSDRLRLIKGAQRAGLRLREIGELLQVADQGQCPCGHTETLLHERLAEVHAELERLHALEADLTRLLERQPDPTCPDMTAGAAAWWCASDCPDPCESSEGR